MSKKQKIIPGLIVLIILLAVPPLFESQKGQEPKAQIPFKTIESWVVISVKINGSREIDMILDTGMPIDGAILLDPEIGKELTLDYMGQVVLGGAGQGQKQTAKVVQKTTLSVSELEFENQNVIVVNKKPASITTAVEGIIGKVIFGPYVVEIDFERSVLNLFDPVDFDGKEKGKEVPLIINGYPFLDTTLNLTGEEEIPVRLVVDLGARHALSLYINKEKKVIPPEKSVDGIIGSGMQGDVFGKWSRISRLEMGPLDIKEVITTFPNEGDSMGLSQHRSDGNLGSQVLRRFFVIFDYQHQRMFLKPNSSYSKPFHFNMAGLLLRQHPDGRKLVYDVIENSPADQKGIKKGDVIDTVNGRDVREYGFEELENLFTQEKENVTLGISRDSGKLDFTLTLKRLI